MTDLKFVNDNDSMPTEVVAVESHQQPEVKMYTVPIAADIQASLTGYVQVYASGFEEAASKVQAQLDAETVDGDIEMEDVDSGYGISYHEMTQCFGTIPEIIESDIEVDEDEEVDPADVLDAEVKQLRATISWDFDTQAKLKTFLETLAEAQSAA